MWEAPMAPMRKMTLIGICSFKEIFYSIRVLADLEDRIHAARLNLYSLHQPPINNLMCIHQGWAGYAFLGRIPDIRFARQLSGTSCWLEIRSIPSTHIQRIKDIIRNIIVGQKIYFIFVLQIIAKLQIVVQDVTRIYNIHES